jgi:glycosyltransferase involved in cell wall biosynthesis
MALIIPQNGKRDLVERDSARGSGRISCLARVPAPVPWLGPDAKPLVSVVIPTYNYGRFLTESVGSTLGQQGVQVQVIVVDDCSTDDTPEVCARLATDDRVTVVRHQHNRGHAVTFNDGFACAEGELIVRLDADDVLTPGSLARAAAVFDAYPNVGLVYGHPHHFAGPVPARANLHERGWSIWAGPDWLADRCRKVLSCITTSEAVVRTSVMRQIGGWETRLKLAGDMKMWLSVAALADVGHIDGPDQVFHREHPDSVSATQGDHPYTDLQERRAAFELFFADMGCHLASPGPLYRQAMAALADEALLNACRAYDRNRLADTDVQAYLDFAADICPAVQDLPHWQPLQRRQRMTGATAYQTLLFAPSLAYRRLRSKTQYRRWHRTGL